MSRGKDATYGFDHISANFARLRSELSEVVCNEEGKWVRRVVTTLGDLWFIANRTSPLSLHQLLQIFQPQEGFVDFAVQLLHSSERLIYDWLPEVY